MKQKKKATDQEEFALLEKPRKKVRQAKKPKFQKRAAWTDDSNEGRGRKRDREIIPSGEYDDDWDEDDQLLYQWRRQGDVDVVVDSEEDEPEELETDDETVLTES